MNWLNAFGDWLDSRMPMLQREWKYHMAEYYAPKNFNFWYFFGVLSLLVLVIQLVTGVWLLMSYNGSAEGAFASVEYIMRDVEMGWIIRYMHSTGASAFFIVVYLHMFRGLIYGSYRAPRELVWIFGMTIYVALMAEAFLGYVLPWGQMSYWGAQVIISLFGAIPYFGDAIVEWIRGDYLISGITLNRFMSLHVVALPIILLALVVMHILALHEVGSNNPDGIEIKQNKGPDGVPLDGVPFFPYYLPVHDMMAIVVFLFVFCTIMFFFPEMGGYFLEYANFEEANPLKTPEHIAPVWYFTPFYSMLRAITFDVGPVSSKLGGFMVMAAAVAIMFVLPWLDRSPVKSLRYKSKLWLTMILVFVASFVILGILGVKAPTAGRTLLALLGTIFYFVFFVTMPLWSADGGSRFFKKLVFGTLGVAFLYLSFFTTNGDLYRNPYEAHKMSMGVRMSLAAGNLDAGDLALQAELRSLASGSYSADSDELSTERLIQKLADSTTLSPLAEKMEHVEKHMLAIGRGMARPAHPSAFLFILTLASALLMFYFPSIIARQKFSEPPERVTMQGMGLLSLVKGLVVVAILTALPVIAVGAESSHACGTIDCEPFEADAKDQESLQNGAKWYMNYCYGCHSLKYSRYERVADDLGIPHQVALDNLVFTGQKIGELMDISMPAENAKAAFGAAPPDLTLVARARSPEWVYTYLKNFYRDDNRPLGVNNRVFKDVGMPHVMLELQGLLECSVDKKGVQDCSRMQTGEIHQGSLTAEEFDTVAKDLTNFLAYTADPVAEQRKSIGFGVLIFLAVLFVLVWLLNREYWRDIH